MKIEILAPSFTVCQISGFRDAPPDEKFCFLSRTDEEISLICPTESVPENTVQREDGWRGFRIEGILDFSLTGILAKISTVLAENGIPIFACSTYNTDYVPVKEEMLDKAVRALEESGYETCDAQATDPKRTTGDRSQTNQSVMVQ